MVVLHFANVDDSQTNGVCVVVPLHVEAQGRYAETALVNIGNVAIGFSGKQLAFQTPFDIQKLPAPFDRPDIVVFHECYRPEYLNIAKDLKNKHIIDNPYYFVIALHFLDDYDQIKPGTYTLSSADSPSEILATLTVQEEEGAKPDDMLRTGCRQTVTGIEEPA